MPIREITRCLHDRDHPTAKCLFARCRDHELKHRLPGSAGKPAQMSSMVQEVRAQHLRDQEDPLGVAVLPQDLLDQQRGSRRPALRRTRRDQIAGLARERE